MAKTAPEIPNIAVPLDHVYRVRGLPLETGSEQTGDFMSKLFSLESDFSRPQMRSLAQSLDGRTMVATLSFRTVPVELLGDGHEWSFDIGALQAETESNGRIRRKRMLTIDDHFLGLTVLSCPPPSDHNVEYVHS